MVVQLFKPQLALPSAKAVTAPAQPKFASEPALPELQKGPSTDVFQRKSPAAAATQVETLLKGDPDKKSNGAKLFELVTGVKLAPGMTTPADEAKQQNLKAAADTIKAMNPQQKVELMQKLTGPESPYSKIAETILVNQQQPTLKEFVNLFKPEVQKPGLSGIGTAFQGAAMGLLMLPIICPATLVFNPSLVGQVLATAAVLAL